MNPILAENLSRLKANPYPGRGIIIGLDSAGKLILQVYWLMGRSQNSQNRAFVEESGIRLFTEPADPSRVQDPSLTIYRAMDAYQDTHVVSNGNQTEAVINSLVNSPSYSGPDLSELENWQYEPDDPNFTPRITGMSHAADNDVFVDFALLSKCALLRGDQCVRNYYQRDFVTPGVGFCLHTYAGPGDPLPPFHGEPYPVPLLGSAEEVLDTYWGALNPEYRISLAVKMIEIATGNSEILIRNRFTRIPT